MIQQDTLQILSDSTKSLQADSLARVDSLAKADSLAMVDSLRVVDSIKTVIRLTRGFVGTPHPSVPQSESWVFIVLLALFFLLAYAVSNSGSLISETAKNFFQVKERSSIFSKATVNDFKIRLFIIIFSIGVISLFVFYQLHNPESPFRILQFCFVLAVTFLFFGVKVLIFDLLGYVFIETSNLKMGKEAYFNIVSFLGMTLFPLLVVQIYIPYNLDNTIETISLIVCILGFILVIFKLFQIFFHKIVASFYILLYLCTLEILPLIATYKVYKLIM
jgi:hypothetical protein